MIRHIAFFSTIDPNNLDAIEAGLWVLKDNPHAVRFSVSRNLNLDEIPGPHPDFVVMADIENEDNWPPTKPIPCTLNPFASCAHYAIFGSPLICC